MKKNLLALAAAAGLVLALGGSGFAQSNQPPGLQMQEKGSVKGSSGASGYAPGQQMQEKGSVKGSAGASGYAPGHNATTGAGINSNTSIDRNGVRSNTDINGNAKVK